MTVHFSVQFLSYIAFSTARSSRIFVRTRFCRLIYLCHCCHTDLLTPLLLPADICHLSARKESPVTVHFLLPVKPHTSSRDHYLEVGLSLALSLTRPTLGRPLSNETSSKKEDEFYPSVYPLKRIFQRKLHTATCEPSIPRINP